MVVVKNSFGKEFYIDGHLSRQLDNVKEKVLDDDDRVFIVDGGERKGKSVFAMQLACKVDPSFCLERVCFTSEDFIKAVKGAKKYQAVVFDEAFTGLASRASLSRVNNLIVSLMMEMGQKNLFVFIVMPSIFFLERYVVLFRANGLFHVYTNKGQRGRWMFFGRANLKFLYLTGKKFFSYKVPKANFRGRFLNQYVVNEKEYRLGKKKSLDAKAKGVMGVREDLVQRNRLLRCLVDEFSLSVRDVSSLVAKYGLVLTYASVSRGVKKAREESSE